MHRITRNQPTVSARHLSLATRHCLSNRNTLEIRIASNSHITNNRRISNRNILHPVSAAALPADHHAPATDLPRGTRGHHISNRQKATPRKLETRLTHTKQSVAPLSNRTKRRISYAASARRLKPLVAACFLIAKNGTPPELETRVNYRKQTTGHFLIANFGAPFRRLSLSHPLPKLRYHGK